MGDAMWVGTWATAGSSGDPRLPRTPTGHAGRVTAVATTVVDGRAVAVTGSRDHTVRTWDLTTGSPLHPPLGCRADATTADGHLVVGHGREVAVLVRVTA
ncbi:hypothetical protein [Streptomyces griseoruber]|uniref:hypothetical protein n=1 Tax=Streptomyces griseoruber TaxID=1943 RepID=UPI000D14EADE|nr:hypothetical protein [Streptomyces griseoruber]